MISLLNLHAIRVFPSELVRSTSESINDTDLLMSSNYQLAIEIQGLRVCDG